MTEARPTIEVSAPPGGWAHPWPNVAEIEAELPHENWTLIGGLMVQLHAICHGVGVVRPTNDVDIVVHVETGRGRPNATARTLRSLGYEIQPALSSREPVAHRFRRNRDSVDVVVAEHAAPRVRESMAGNEMVSVEGGTQALRRTVNARLQISGDRITTVSVPDPYGALILKSAAHKTDSRDPERHLLDAAALLACIDDPYAERERPASGSDRPAFSICVSTWEIRATRPGSRSTPERDPTARQRSTSSSATIEVFAMRIPVPAEAAVGALAAREQRPMAAAVYGLRVWTRVRASRLRWSVSGRVWRYVWVVWIWAWPMRSMTYFAVGSRQHPNARRTRLSDPAHVPSDGHKGDQRAGEREPGRRAARPHRPKVTVEHYIRRNEHVNPLTAELLETVFVPDDPLGGRDTP